MRGATSLFVGDKGALDFDPVPGGDLSMAAPVTLLDSLKQSAFRAFLGAGWVLTLAIVTLALAYTPSAWWVVFASTAGNFVAGWIARGGHVIVRLRSAVVLLVSIQPLAVLVALRLSGFDALTPLAIFVALMALTAFCDRVVIYAAAAITLVSLVAMDLVISDWLFMGNSLSRDLIYAAEHLVVTVVAATIAHRLQQLVAELESAQSKSAARADQLHEQAGELERALESIEAERQERERVVQSQKEKRHAQMQRIAQDFENSISVVTHSISDTAALLEATTRTLSAIAHDTGQGAAKVSEGAAAASHAARMVAQGVAELSSSIGEIAADASQQSELASQATKRSTSGGYAVGGLAKHSDTIGEATRAIVRIAERTNLLSLNAAIEAASAGPAGRGFTIVAQEVKALATQASQAATEIDTFLKGVRAGTLEAERSFEAIDSAIGSLAQTSTAIRWEVESQRKSADTIEDYARSAAEDVGAMAVRSETLAGTASAAEKLSKQLDEAAQTMLGNVRDLEQSTAQFVSNLKAG